MPRNITVTFSDGSSHVYQNAPDTLSPADVQQRAATDFSGKTLTGIDGGNSASTVAAPPLAPPASLSDTISNGIKSAASAVSDAAASVGGSIRNVVTGLAHSSETSESPFAGSVLPPPPPPAAPVDKLTAAVPEPQPLTAVPDHQPFQLLDSEKSPARVAAEHAAAAAPQARAMTPTEVAQTHWEQEGPLKAGFGVAAGHSAQTIGHALTAIGEATDSEGARTMGRDFQLAANARIDHAMHGNEDSDTVKTLAGVFSLAPLLAGSAPGMAEMVAQSGIDGYGEARNAGDTPAEAVSRGTAMALANYVGMRIRVPGITEGLMKAVQRAPAGEAIAALGHAVSTNVGGMEATTALSDLYDKMAPGGLKPNMTAADMIRDIGDTAKSATLLSLAVPGLPLGASHLYSTAHALAHGGRGAADAARAIDGAQPPAAADLGAPADNSTAAAPAPVVGLDTLHGSIDEAAGKVGLAPKAAAALRDAVANMDPQEAAAFTARAFHRFEANGLTKRAGAPGVFRDLLSQRLADQQPAEPPAAPAPPAGKSVADQLGAVRPPEPVPAAADAPTEPAPITPEAIAKANEIADAAHQAATSPFNERPEPTDAQKAAGNYAMGHVQLHGLDITIENPQGSVRSGVDPDGRPWATEMAAHYGYLKGTHAADGDHVDTFIGPNPESKTAYVIDQVDPNTGKFDEPKTILGADSEAQARELYAANYADGWNGLGAITPLPMDAFKAWVRDGVKSKPLGDISQWKATDERAQPDLAKPADVAPGAGDGGGGPAVAGGGNPRPDSAVPAGRGLGGDAVAPAGGARAAGAVGDGATGDRALSEAPKLLGKPVTEYDTAALQKIASMKTTSLRARDVVGDELTRRAAEARKVSASEAPLLSTTDEKQSPEAHALKAISEHDDFFQLPKSPSKTVDGIVADTAPQIKVKKLNLPGPARYEFTMPDGSKADMTVRDPNPYGPSVYDMSMKDGEAGNIDTERPGENPGDVDPTKGDVWIDVSKLKRGGNGTAIYNIAATFAHNTGRIFIGDPAGLSNDAMARRSEQMLSSALKFGTTDHLAPSKRQTEGDEKIGVPPLKWVYGDHLGNIRRLIDLNLKVQENRSPDVHFDPATGHFLDASGRVLDRAELAVLANEESQHGGAPGGGSTLARSAVLRALLREEGAAGSGEVGGRDGLLARFAKLADDAPVATEGILYSHGDESPALKQSGAAPRAGVDPVKLRSEVAKIQAGWKDAPPVHVVDDVDGLPRYIQESLRSMGAENKTRALLMPGHGTDPGDVYLIANRLKDVPAAQAALFHEVLGHYGIRKVLGSDAEYFAEMYKLRQANPALAQEAEAWFRAHGRGALAARMERGLSQEAAMKVVRALSTEEALADRAGRGEPIRGLQSLMAKIQQWLRSVGLGSVADRLEGMTEAETAALLARARSTVEAQDVVTYHGDEMVPALSENDSQPPLLSQSTEADEKAAAGAHPTTALARVRAAAGAAADAARSLRDDALLKVAPMALGTDQARAVAKDFANADRLARWQWGKFDDILKKNYSDDERRTMWEAADEEGVLRQQDKTPGPIQGLNRLTPDQRATMDALHNYGENLLQRARDVGMFEGEGLPYWTPRMAVMIGDDGEYQRPKGANVEGSGSQGRNIVTSASSLKGRKHLTAEDTEAAMKGKLGEGAQLVRDIRTMPLAMARLERAIAGRELVDNIKALGDKSGIKTVSSTGEPDFFTVDHPAFKTWRVTTGEDGSKTWEPKPLYVNKAFEGPLKAVMTEKPDKIYNALMAIKGKSMGLIMYSPLIHNAVEWGRALPAMPGKVATFQIYFEGNKIKNDPVQMRQAITDGLVPIGRRGGIQDITGIMEDPSLTPGRSWTAKLLGGAMGIAEPVSKPVMGAVGKAVGVVSPKAGKVVESLGTSVGVKKGVDAAGDFWHNTLLWDRVGDLQAGLYGSIREHEIAKGMDPAAAGKVAAHFANRFAGALPNEAMAVGARRVANLLMFSRTFTLGNMGLMKDMVNGLPRDVRAQIKMQAGELAAAAATSRARRIAIASFIMDIGLMYIGNSLLQDTIKKLRGEKTWAQNFQGYADRLSKLLKRTGDHPLQTLSNPFDVVNSLSSTSENEPGKEDRIRVGTSDDGTAIYMRLPTGKVGEDFKNWITKPLVTAKAKESQLVRPLQQVWTNDNGIGQRIYDPDAEGLGGVLSNAGRIAKLFATQMVPADAIQGAWDWKKGTATDVDKLKVVGPFAGLTFSKGAPGGPAVGAMYAADRKYEGAKMDVLPQVKQAVKDGEDDKAIALLEGIKMPPSEIMRTLRHLEMPESRLSAGAFKHFSQRASDDDMEKFNDLMDAEKERAAATAAP